MKERPSILLLTKFRRPWNNGYFMAKALEDMGWAAICLDTPSQLDELSHAIERRPVLAITTKADGMTTDMIQEIRSHGIPFVMWHPDPIPPDEHMITIGRPSDFFFTMTQGRIPEYKAAGIEKVAWLSQAFAPSFYPITPLTPEDMAHYGSQVAFVGNLGTLPQYVARRQMLDEVINTGFQLKWWGPRPSRKLKDLPFLFSRVCRSYGGEFVYHETFSKVARACKIFLSLDSYPDVRLSMSVRIYIAVGCGAFYLCRHVEGIEEVLVPGKEIEVFHDHNEMTDKIRYYLTHEDDRRRIARAGRQRVLGEYTYEHRFASMFETLKGAGILGTWP
jgi:spore maturation protein CgeB